MILERKHETPPGGFRYTQPETKMFFRTVTWRDLVQLVHQHRRANNLPVGLFFEQEIEQQLCGELPPGWCREPTVPPSPGRGALTLKEIILGTKTLASWVMGGGKRVELQEANRRASICVGCPMNQEIADCSACNETTLRAAVELVTSGGVTDQEGKLKACAVCGCSNKAQVWLPLDILQKHLPDEMNARLPDICWKKINPVLRSEPVSETKPVLVETSELENP